MWTLHANQKKKIRNKNDNWLKLRGYNLDSSQIYIIYVHCKKYEHNTRQLQIIFKDNLKNINVKGVIFV